MTEAHDAVPLPDDGSSANPAPSSLRGTAISLVLIGLVGFNCWLLTRAWADVLGGVAVHSMIAAVGVGYIVAGLALWWRGRRWQNVVRNSALVLAVVGILLKGPHDAALLRVLTNVCSLAFVLLLWGSAGRIRRVVGFSVLGVCALAVVVGTIRIRQTVPLHGPPVVFELILVEDGSYYIENASGLPPGMSVARERINGEIRYYLRYAAQGAVSHREARALAESWANRTLSMGEGLRLVFARDREEPGSVLRSYLFHGAPIATAADVQDARVSTTEGSDTVAVDVSLRDGAAKRLQEITRENVGSCVAIVFDGEVQLAPLVKGEISDGRLRVSLAPGGTVSEANGLAAGMRGELLHGP